MDRRSLLEKYVDVLDVINKGRDRPSRIMGEARLSRSSHRGVFDTLTKNGFIREEKGKTSKRYYITKKGRNAVSYHLSVKKEANAR
jgi:predicted transcriptional regulator